MNCRCVACAAQWRFASLFGTPSTTQMLGVLLVVVTVSGTFSFLWTPQYPRQPFLLFALNSRAAAIRMYGTG